MKGELLVLGATVFLSGCSVAHENYLRVGGEGRPEWARGTLSLGEKSRIFEGNLPGFLSPDGLLIYRQPSGGGFVHAPMGDVCIWTGTALAAESLRFAATSDPHAFERASLFLRGLETLHDVTGVRGLFARNAVPPEAPGVEVGALGDWNEGNGRFSGWFWKGDVSKDQYAGALFGLAAAWDCVPDAEFRKRIARLGGAVADHLLSHDFRIVDVKGKPTKYGDLSARIAMLPIGVNALISLAALKLAAVSTGDRKYAEAYADKIDRGWAKAAYWAKFQLLGLTNYNNDNMAFLSLYALLLFEDDLAVRENYLRALRRSHSYVYREGNSFFSMVAAAFGVADARSLEEAKLNLDLFPVDRRGFAFDHSADPRFEHAWLPSRKGRLRAALPLPVNWRSPTSFAWKDDPFELEGAKGEEGQFVYPGSDYLLAYWLGRRHRLLGEDE